MYYSINVHLIVKPLAEKIMNWNIYMHEKTWMLEDCFEVQMFSLRVLNRKLQALQSVC